MQLVIVASFTQNEIIVTCQFKCFGVQYHVVIHSDTISFDECIILPLYVLCFVSIVIFVCIVVCIIVCIVVYKMLYNSDLFWNHTW